MKRTALILLALLVCLTNVLALASCGLDDIEITENTEISADNKADSLELVNDFFEKTLKTENFVVTAKSDDEVIWVNTVEGDKSFLDYKASETEMYAFKQGEEFITAVASEDSQYYMTGEEMYRSYYCYFMSNFKMLELIPEESADFQCIVKEEVKGSESTSTLTLDVTAAGGTIQITATAKNGLVESLTFSVNELETGEQRTVAMTFAYVPTTVTVPDITDWYEMPVIDSSDDEGEDDFTDEGETDGTEEEADITEE